MEKGKKMSSFLFQVEKLPVSCQEYVSTVYGTLSQSVCSEFSKITQLLGRTNLFLKLKKETPAICIVLAISRLKPKASCSFAVGHFSRS